ncbi:MAG TPA: VCBS repeat-containing protein, partial [Thermoanaerobaculia bacterium]|nr:VCBS repeat-containing protein [Thermoanaerobaculia bacterium]
MKRTLAGLSLLLLLSGAKKPAAPPPPPPVGVTAARSGAAEVVRAVLPGLLAGVELPRGADGKLDVVLLLRAAPKEDDHERWNPSEESTDEGPPGARSLQLLDLTGSLLRSLLPEVQTGTLGALDLDGDGAEEILLATKGELRSLGSASRPSERTILDLSATDLRFPSRWRDQQITGVLASGVGTVRLYLPNGGGLAPSVERELPSRASRERWGIRLTSPRVRSVRGDGDLLAAGPEAEGRQRLRSLLIGAESTTEVWSLLPGPEEVDTAWYVKIGGRPSLIVTTHSADKIGIFESKKLRVFPLTADRTRAGRRPLLATQTTSHRWLPVAPLVTDLDRDGKDDLVVLQHDGMGGGEIVAETFFGRGDGRFETPGRRQKWDLQTRDFHYGHDLTGDGIADLAVVEPRRLVVYPGTKEPRKALLERKPLEVPLNLAEEAGIRGLRVADLDGDGRAEAVLTGSAGTGRDVVMVA